MGNHIYVSIPVMALLGVLQASILARFPVAGVAPQLLFVVALGWGLVRGLEEGLVWAFVAGVFSDLFSIGPMGLSSLAFMVGVGGPLLLREALPPRRLLVATLLAALGTLLYLFVYVLVLRLFGRSVSLTGFAGLLPLMLFHAVLIAPVFVLLNTINRVLKPRRVEM
jgi:rod shape-determining protein MreD